MYVCMFIFCHRSRDLIYYQILMYLHKSIVYDNSAIKFAIQGDGVKVKIAEAIFRRKKNFVITPASLFIGRFLFNFT